MSSPSSSTSSSSSNTDEDITTTASSTTTTVTATSTTTAANTASSSSIDDVRTFSSVSISPVYDTISVEEVRKLVVKEGVAGIVDLRVRRATYATLINRIDLLTYFIEERRVCVNDFTEEEEEYFAARTEVDEKRDVLRLLPLQSALMGGHEESADYLMDYMQKEEVNTLGIEDRTALM